jgi:hypothetical protein
MENARKVNKTWIFIGAIFVAVGILMVIEGIQHTISGEIIAATTWDESATGPEQTVIGFLGACIGIAGMWMGWRGERRS